MSININGYTYRVAEALDEFTRAYLEAALWSSTDEDGQPLDINYGIDDIDPECLQRMIDDCARFQAENEEILAEAEVSSRYSIDEQAGHDFWLTRNRHGAGFWDGDWSEPYATQLTEAAEAFHSVELMADPNEGVVICV